MTRLKLLALGAVISSARAGFEHDCGFAPLCGTHDKKFELKKHVHDGFPVEVNGSLIIAGTHLELEPCCSLRDTKPVKHCEIVNPNGAAERFITDFTPLCDLDPAKCKSDGCKKYVFAFKPHFLRADHDNKCCVSCSCYGDPQCKSFHGKEKVWVLCDGRQAPESDDKTARCFITEEKCLEQKDHAGNQCEYLASDPTGQSWNVVEKGSPCVPNPKSPPSYILMYSVPKYDFSLSVQQGERGTIIKVDLQLECGNFSLSAVDCLKKGANAWMKPDGDLPNFFEFQSLVDSHDILWNIIDPATDIAINLRCFGNEADDGSGSTDGVFVPRINVEDLSDPERHRKHTEGFCVSGKLNTGKATTSNTDFIDKHKLCIDGLANFPTLEIFRAICQNPALPQSGEPECIFDFCSRFYYPLFPSVKACVEEFSKDLSEAFCRAIVDCEEDVQPCLNQWNELGAITTINQFLYDRTACSGHISVSPGDCQSGVTLQFLDHDSKWVDVIFVPEDFCFDETYEDGVIVLNLCDYPQVFTRPIRFAQNSLDIKCGPINRCKRIEEFTAFVAFGVPVTPHPTPYPTNYPTKYPTQYPTPYPTKYPTPYPTEYPTKYPTPYPTKYPTPYPTNYPTKYPTPYPEKEPTHYPTPYPEKAPTPCPEEEPTHYPTPYPEKAPTPYPTKYPTPHPAKHPVHHPAKYPTKYPMEWV